MAIQPITGTDTVAYIDDTVGNRATAAIVIPVNADGSAMGGGSVSSPSISGGEYNSTPPTLTNGQTDALQLTSNGQLQVALTTSTGALAGIGTAAADAVATSTVALVTRGFGYGFNGTTWDRTRGDTTGTFVKSNPLTGTDRSVTATTTSAQLMAANTTRSKFFIKNDTAIVVWINMGATAVASAGSGNISIAANGGYFEFTGYSGAVNIIAASTTAAVTAREF